MSPLILTTFVLIFSFSFVNSDPASMYDGHKMLRVTPANEAQLNELKELKKSLIQFAIFEPKIGDQSDMIVSPSQMEMVSNSLGLYGGIVFEETIPDIGKFIRSQKVSSSSRNGRLQWDEYYTLDAIYEYLEIQAATHSPIATLENIGVTYEGRNLTMIKISNSVGGPSKPSIYIESNIHAREWITGAVGTHIIDQLLNGPDPEMQAYVDDFDFYILPIANPDGFAYTHEADRFWRKTRSNSTSPFGCKGADPNRNFDAFWMENGGASDDPCSNTYAGSAPESEPEIKAMVDFMSRPEVNNAMRMYLSLHSSGQFILIPTGRDNVTIPKYIDYMTLGNRTADAHFATFGKVYRAGSIFEIMYPATGSSLDWAYLHVPTAKFHVTYELRDKGQYGHLLPPNQIEESCIEFLAGLKVLLDDMKLP